MAQHRLDLLERVMLEGDLSRLTVEERVAYYAQVCESVGLNPLTRPFDYLVLNGRLVLYANKNCAEQLRRNMRISISLTDKRVESGVYLVTARAEADGRYDEATGAVSIEGLKGNDLANALMKAETKAKRRATLSLAGLGMLDETEVETLPDARRVSERDVTPSPQEERRKALASLPDDVKNGLNWVCRTQGLTGRERSTKIHAVFDEHHGDVEGIREWLREQGWLGSADLSDVALEDKMEDAT